VKSAWEEALSTGKGGKKERAAQQKRVFEKLEKEMNANMLMSGRAAHPEGTQARKEFESRTTVAYVKQVVVFVAFLSEAGLSHLEALRNCNWGKLADVSNHPTWSSAFSDAPTYKLGQGFELASEAVFATSSRHVQALLTKVFQLHRTVDPRTKGANKSQVEQARKHIVYYHLAFAAWAVFSQVETGKGTRDAVQPAMLTALFPTSGGLTPEFDGCTLIQQLDEDIQVLCTYYNDEFGEAKGAPSATLMALLGHPRFLYKVLLCSLNLVRKDDGVRPWPADAPRRACQKILDAWQVANPSKHSTTTELALRGMVSASTRRRKAAEQEERAKKEALAAAEARAQAAEEAKKTQLEKAKAVRTKAHLAEQEVRQRHVTQLKKEEESNRIRAQFITEVYGTELGTDPRFELFTDPVHDVLVSSEQSLKKAPKMVWLGLFGHDFALAPDWAMAVKAVWKKHQHAQIAVHLDQKNASAFIAQFEAAKVKPAGESSSLQSSAVCELPYVLGTSTESLANAKVGRDEAGWAPHSDDGGSMVHSVIIVLHSAQKKMEAQLEKRAAADRDCGV
jgi:hypothetical protein